MAMTRIWNITDAKDSKVPAVVLVELGKVIKPGRFVQVDEASLVSAHKVQLDLQNKLIFIGKTLPANYLAAKSPIHAVLDPLAKRAHGKPEVKAELPKETKGDVQVPAPPVDNDHVAPGAEQFSTEAIAQAVKSDEQTHRHGKRRNWNG